MYDPYIFYAYIFNASNLSQDFKITKLSKNLFEKQNENCVLEYFRSVFLYLHSKGSKISQYKKKNK